MTTAQKQFVWILATILVAAFGQLAIDLADATVSNRLMAAHTLTAIVTTVGALLAKFPQRIWSDTERGEKLNQPQE